MHDFFEKQPDPFEALLAPPPLPPDGTALQQALREQTTRLLRRRRHVRRLAWAAALAACYAAGALTMRWVAPPPAPPAPNVAEHREAPPRPEEKPPPAPERDSALAREWKALDAVKRERERQLYREAGDGYLHDDNDLASAARCYGNELSAGTRADLTISPDDNWLLMAIKSARQKEQSHAKNGG